MYRCFSRFTAREDAKAGDRVRQGEFEAPVFIRETWGLQGAGRGRHFKGKDAAVILSREKRSRAAAPEHEL